jgi:hypothetical protein
MSSHHFVREGQEPALLIIDPINFEMVQPLLEWAPLVLVADVSVEEILLWGIKIDLVVETHNGEEIRSLLDGHGPVKFLSSKHHILEDALEFLVRDNHSAVSVITNHPESYFDIAQQFAGKIKITFLASTLKWSLISTGIFNKWFPGGTSLWLPASIVLQTENLQSEADRHTVVKDGMVKVAGKDIFWIAEEVY